MVARFRAATVCDKGRAALEESKLQPSSWSCCQLLVSFFLGIIATFVWLFWDLDAETTGIWFQIGICMHLASVICFCCFNWLAQSCRDAWSDPQVLQFLNPRRLRALLRCVSLCVVIAASFVTDLALRDLKTIVTISATFIDTIGDLGSSASQSFSGGLPGDSEHNLEEPAVEFLTPDLLERSWRHLEPNNDLRMPWKRWIWGSIFCNKQFGSPEQSANQWKRLIPPSIQQLYLPDRPVKPLKRSQVAEHWRQVVSNTDSVSWREDQEAKMDFALKRWFDIISHFPDIHETVKQLYLVPGLPEQFHMLRDILADKAPETLTKRANAMLRYIEKLRVAKVAVPGDEAFLCNYFCEMRAAGCPLSRLRSLVESIRFTEFVFGIDGLSQKLLSRRCLGASRRSGETVVRQSDLLTVTQLACLHEVLLDDKALFWDRLVSGSTLMAVYTRSRWMDMQHTDEIVLDPNELGSIFEELKIEEFKTKKANAWRGGTMAAVGPAVGVVQGNWVATWGSLRQKLDAALSDGYPLMPAPNGEGEPTVRPLSTSKLGKWVRMILDWNSLLHAEAKITSHSCKATLLSFLAKYGASIPDREILGGHTGHMKSVLTYSRDALATPLRALEDTLQKIRSGNFDPNASGSGMMITEVKQEAVVIEDDAGFKLVSNDQVALDEEAGAEPGSGNDTSSDSEEEQVTGTHAARMVSAPRPPQGINLLQHPKSRMLRLIQEEHTRYLMCGRKVQVANESLCKPPASLWWDTPCCSHCWRAANTPLGSRLR